jgi:hypothetical protein
MCNSMHIMSKRDLLRGERYRRPAPQHRFQRAFAEQTPGAGMCPFWQ